jgi:hypothetical protein
MFVREVSDNGFIDNQDDCRLSLDSGGGTIVEYNTPVLNFQLFGSDGHFDGDKPFAVDPGLELDDLCLSAEGTVRIPAGQEGRWTFGVNSDDGFTLQFPDHDFLTVVNGELTDLGDGIAMQFFGNRTANDTLGTIDLPEGDHRFRLTYHQSYEWAELEFFAAPGTHTAFDSDVFRLVGQPDIGRTPVPGFCGDVWMTATRPGGETIDSLADALAALSTGEAEGTNRFQPYSSVNHTDQDLGSWDRGFFPDDSLFPNYVPGGLDYDTFAVRVRGLLHIPTDGTYQIGFNFYGGASLRISGQTWKSIVATESPLIDTGNTVIAGDQLSSEGEWYEYWVFAAGEIDLAAGCHAFEAVLYNKHYSSTFFELFGRGVSNRGIPDPAWHRLRRYGARPAARISGLQLVETE